MFQQCFDQKETRTQELPLNPKNHVFSRTACFETQKNLISKNKVKKNPPLHIILEPDRPEANGSTFPCKMGWRNNLIVIFDSQNLRHPKKHTETSKNPVNGGDRVPQLA